VLLAICDVEILGKTFQDGKMSFAVREEFYKGSKMNTEEALNLIKQSTIVNMVGQNIVTEAVKKGFVHSEAVLKISGVSHAQIVKI